MFLDVADTPKIWLPPKPAIIRPCEGFLTPAQKKGIELASFMPVLPPPGKNKSFAYLGTQVSATNTTTHTFTGMSFGGEHATRRILAVFGYSGTDARTVSSTSIGGSAGTQFAAFSSTDFAGYGASRAFATGLSGNVAITFSGAMNRCAVSLYAIYNFVNSTPTDIGGVADTVTSVTVTDFDFTSIANKTLVFGGCHYANNSNTNRYWSSAYRYFATGGSFSPATINRTTTTNVNWPNSMTEAIDGQLVGIAVANSDRMCGMFFSWA